jgi:hypothetical protein
VEEKSCPVPPGHDFFAAQEALLSLLQNDLFAQTLRYAQKIILDIFDICLW